MADATITRTIAIDAMGGDKNPAKIAVRATLKALRQYPTTRFVLIGDESEIRRHLSKRFENPRIKIVHASDRIKMDEEVGLSIRNRKDSSLHMAITMVKDGKADACFSCGNTKAYVALATLILGRIAGFERPALAATLPGGTLFLDVGASVDSTKEMLLSWAIGAGIFVQKVYHKENPVVAQLSIGGEIGKGDTLTKDTRPLLVEAAEKGWFTLSPVNIEPNQLLDGTADIILTDGFAGNVALKSMEGVFEKLSSFVKALIKKCPPLILLVAPFYPVYWLVKNRFGYRKFNGAPLIGTDGICIKGHGRSDQEAFLSGIGAAIRAAEADIVSLIKAAIAQ